MLSVYITLFHFFMLKVLHIITLALWVGAAMLALQLSKVMPGTHITPGWREASEMKHWAVPGIEPGTWSYDTNTLTTEPPISQ